MAGAVAVSGGGLHVERAGEGVPLLLVSGGGGDAGAYADVVPRPARTYTVIGYDRRGGSRGPSPDPKAPVAVERRADDAVTVLDHYGRNGSVYPARTSPVATFPTCSTRRSSSRP